MFAHRLLLFYCVSDECARTVGAGYVSEEEHWVSGADSRTNGLREQVLGQV